MDNTIQEKILEKKPIIHCITNPVTVNDCANVLLAVGASPTMASHPLEVEEVTAGSSALVCNMGAILQLESMINAGKMAEKLGKPIVLDPVGVGGSSFRRQSCQELIQRIHPSCIRGNLSEIKILTGMSDKYCGIDAAGEDRVLTEEIQQGIMDYAVKHSCIMVATGETDFLTDGKKTIFIKSGSPMMGRITGCGCMLSALLGAFLAMEPDALEVAAQACRCMGECGEKAEKRTKLEQGGTMTFRLGLIDELSIGVTSTV